jgi:hypothetical protein
MERRSICEIFSDLFDIELSFKFNKIENKFLTPLHFFIDKKFCIL